ncbi:putative ribonuclease H-like domain-containing protein [Tanacetum coccineum]
MDVLGKTRNKVYLLNIKNIMEASLLLEEVKAEAISTACYVLNRVLVTKPQNKTPYELITGKIPIISYIRPFGFHVTILNTIDHLGKFAEKFDEGFLVGYSRSSKAFRVYNLETKRVEENLHLNFLENKPNVTGKRPNWLFDLDYLTDSINYQPITAKNKANKTAGPREANHSAGTQDNINAENSKMEVEPAQEYFLLPLWSFYTLTVKSSKAKNGDKNPNGDTGPKINEEAKDQEDQAFLEELKRLKRQENETNNAAEAFRKDTASPSRVFSAGGPDLPNNDQDDSQIPALEEIYDNPSDGIFTNASYDDEHAVADFTNLETTMNLEIRQGWLPRDIDKRKGSPVARIEAIRIFLAFASYMGFIVYQIDVNSTFLYGIIDEEVYVSQPSGFVDPKIPKKSGYRRRTIDKTLFIKKDRNNIMLVQSVLVLECNHLTWKPILIVTMLEQTLTGNPQYEVVNFLSRDLSHGNERCKQLWLLLLQRHSMLLLPTAVGKIQCFTLKQSILRLDTTSLGMLMRKSLFSCINLGEAKWQVDLLYSLENDVEFWNTTTSKIVNDVSYIKVKVAGKTVSISEASIKRDLLFHDVDGIYYLTNQEIYENLQLIGNLDAKKQFLMYPRFVQVFLNNQLSNLPVPLDNLPILVLTKKVFTNMAKQGLHFSGHVTPLFPNMLAQAVVDEGEGSAQPIEPQPTPSPTQPSTRDQPPMTESSYRPGTTQVPRDSLKGTDGSKED